MTADNTDEPVDEAATASADDATSPAMSMKFATPWGVYDSVEDLPPEVRQMLLESLDSLPMPDELREALRTQLNTITPEPPDTHAPLTRERIWAILDEAFPTQPHLWQATEMLLGYASKAGDPDAQRLMLDVALTHLQHHQKLTGHSTTLSATEQLVSDFRDELGNL